MATATNNGTSLSEQTDAKKNGTSLLAQTGKKKEKWGGDPHNYDIQGAIKNYDTNLAKYNDINTSQDEKDAINAQYGGDITKWDNKTAYDDYNADLKYIDYVDTLNKGYGAAMDSAAKAESQKMQYADTRRQLMQKYLPETLMAQGVANTGYTADALLKAENNYNQYVMGAMNERAATEQNAMQSYQDALGQFKQEQNEEAYERFLAREEQQKQAEQESKDYQSTLYNGAIELLNEGYTAEQVKQFMAGNNADESTIAKFDEFYAAGGESGITGSTASGTSGSTGKLTADTDYNYTSQNFQVSTSRDKDRFKLQGANDVFRVSVGGKDYKAKTGDKIEVEEGDTDSDNAKLLQYANDKVAKGAVFLFKGKVYVKDSDGSVYPVNQKGWAKDAYKAIKEGLTNEFKSQYSS
jgi:hypothetical protein